MGEIHATYDNSVRNETKEILNSLLSKFNANFNGRSITISVTQDISKLGLNLDDYMKVNKTANYTYSRSLKNDSIFSNPDYDYATSYTTLKQSLMHELTHIGFPGIAKGTYAHEEPFYAQLFSVSQKIGVPMSISDMQRWAEIMHKRGVPDAEIEEIFEKATGQPPEKIEEHKCFLAGTSIRMADGSERAIETVQAGDLVLAFDPSSQMGRGALVPKRIVRSFVNAAQAVYDLHGLFVTQNHGGGKATEILWDRDDKNLECLFKVEGRTKRSLTVTEFRI